MASAEMLRNKTPCSEGEIKKNYCLKSEITVLKAKEEKKNKCTIEMFCLEDNKNRKYLIDVHRSNSYTDRVFQLGSVQERKLVVQ